MADSILDSTKAVLGIEASYDVFDPSIIQHINTAFAKLHQLGIGPDTGFEITNDSTEWDAYNVDISLNSIKDFVYLQVRLLFDPPPTSFGIQALQSELNELAWRINARREEVKYPWMEQIVMERPIRQTESDPF